MILWLNHIVDRIEGVVITTLMLVATVFAVVQVAARYIFNNSLYWSEELILYSLISMSFLSASMGVRYSAHISVEALYAFVSPRVARILHYVATILGLLFAISLVWYGGRLSFATLQMNQLSSAMRIPVGLIYFIIPISGLFMALRYLLIMRDLLAGRDYIAPEIGIKNA